MYALAKRSVGTGVFDACWAGWRAIPDDCFEIVPSGIGIVRLLLSAVAGAAVALMLSQAAPTPALAQTLNQDAFATEEGPHFFNNKCCFCKEATSVQATDGGYLFLLTDGRKLFVESHMIRPSEDGNQWYCPAHQGSERCGLIQLGS